MRGTRGFDELVCERLLKKKMHQQSLWVVTPGTETRPLKASNADTPGLRGSSGLARITQGESVRHKAATKSPWFSHATALRLEGMMAPQAWAKWRVVLRQTTSRTIPMRIRARLRPIQRPRAPQLRRKQSHAPSGRPMIQ